jgi:hypothetical protein
MMNEKGKEGTATRKLVEMYSVVVQEFFQIRVQHWIDTIGKQIFRIKHYYIRYEFAKGRGMIHAHILAITASKSGWYRVEYPLCASRDYARWY